MNTRSIIIAATIMLTTSCGSKPDYLYTCRDGAIVEVSNLNKDDLHVKIIREGYPLVEFDATHDPSGSGAKYVGGDYSYWSNGDECLIEYKGNFFIKKCRLSEL